MLPQVTLVKGNLHFERHVYPLSSPHTEHRTGRELWFASVSILAGDMTVGATDRAWRQSGKL